MKLNPNFAKSGRLTLGLFLVGYALNQFLHVFPTSYGRMPEVTQDFIDSVAIYLPYLYLFEIIIGLLLVFNKWVALILVMLVPLSVSFLIFTFVNGDPGKMWPALLVALLNVVLLIHRKDKYLPLLD